MALLPTEVELTGSTVTNAQQKTRFASLRNFIADMLGTDSADKAAARTNLSVPSVADVHGWLGGFKNVLINGNFDVWDYATSQTTSGYGSDNRWKNNNIGSTKTHSQQAFALGQADVPHNPKFFSRTVVTTAAGAGNHVVKEQRIESVRTLAGKKATLSFYAKADAAKNIAVEFFQYFGTGGTPSAAVSGIGSQLVALTTTLKKYTITVDIPSIAGKTLGTDGNDWLGLNFWFDAGSDFNTRTASLGQQSGTFDIAQVELVEGSVSLGLKPLPYDVEEMRCKRYYQVLRASLRFNASGASQYGNCTVNFKEMRASPSVTAGTVAAQNLVTKDDLHVGSNNSARYEVVASGAGDVYSLFREYKLAAEL